MAEVLTPFRIARAHNASVAAGVTETQEIDFEFALSQGALLYVAEFALLNVVIATMADNDDETAAMSLHAETGALEDTLDGVTDEVRLDSEVIGEAAYHVAGSDDFGGAGVGAAKSMAAWTGERRWDYHAMLGQPLLIAQNLTFRVDATAGLTVNGATVRIFYKYVRLSRSELAQQFLLRR